VTEIDMGHIRRFGGMTRLYGRRQAEQIFSSHVVVVGVGGVGSWVAEALARSGVGRITLIDMDHVSESNINRQVLALSETIGVAKINAMSSRIKSINPDCHLHLIDDFVSPENWPSIFLSLSAIAPIDAVVDACDQLHAKLALSVWALQNNSLFISVGAAGGKKQAHLVTINDLSQTTHDPLLAKLRYSLRRRHDARREGQIGVTCVFSREPVHQPIFVTSDESCSLEEVGDGTLNCHGYGSVVSVTATFGFCSAGWVLNGLARNKK